MRLVEGFVQQERSVSKLLASPGETHVDRSILLRQGSILGIIGRRRHPGSHICIALKLLALTH